LAIIHRMGQWLCCGLLCLYMLQIHLLCLTMTKSLFHHHTYKTRNCWHSVGAHSQNWSVTVLLSLLWMKAANTLVMPNSDYVTIQLLYLQDQKSLMLHWRSFSEWGSDHVAVSFAYDAANTLVMPNSDQLIIQLPYLQDQISLTLLWHSLSIFQFNICCDQSLFSECFDRIGSHCDRLWLGPVAKPSPVKFLHCLLSY